ncbi:holo-ACP synthase [Cohnella soli]|uniref:Holo-[acyl-carrier-protein] synthase n=1 Tax=Cohnella soli TaxID=425005 RepID=A0ABW0I1C1_9BACL
MIYGIGIDIQTVHQIRDMLDRQADRFLKKVFTSNEIAYCENYRSPEVHYAGRWAVKEAYLKAIGTGMSGGYKLSDIETVRLESGKPHVILHGSALEHYWQYQYHIYVSISHSGDYAVAQIVLDINREHPEDPRR